MAATRSAVINVMARAAAKAGRALVRDFGEVEQLQVSMKGPADFVSAADRKAERILREELRKARPAWGLLMEESGETEGDDPDRRWIVDPLDGTTNFLHGIPHFAVSIGVEQEGELTAGLVYNPVTDDMYWAEKGQGAFHNDRRLRVSGRRKMEEALTATGAPFLGHGDPEVFRAELMALMPRIAGVRRFGAASLDLAFVAAGRFDGFWERGLSPWDVAAGIVLVREAGGFVSEIGGGHSPLTARSILAANPHLHLPMGQALRAATEGGAGGRRAG
jgi:myo-inositol-1(or 4)-monophosphatase